MQFLVKTCALSLLVSGLAACGGDNERPRPDVSSATSSSAPTSSAPASSSVLSSSAPASSSAVSSSAPASSSMASSSAAPTETTLTATSYGNYSVAEIQNCGLNISKPANTFQVFADYDAGVQNQSLAALNFSSWNHTTNGSTAEWAKLKHPGATYNLGTTAAVNNSCNGVDAANIVLVRKFADWDRRHSNGFERNILQTNSYNFGNIKNIIVDLKVNSARTTIPTVETLKTTYASYATPAQIEELEGGKVNIGMVIYDKLAPAEQQVWTARTIIELDQAAVADKWVRVTIPMANVRHCVEQNYSCTDKTLAEFSNQVVGGIRFVGEGKTENSLRHKVQSTWATNTPPETFKEMDISIKKIEFELK